ncbi:MAG: pilin [Candidatus Paceibacterota bacterium]|jgi:hypothetical protein
MNKIKKIVFSVVAGLIVSFPAYAAIKIPVIAGIPQNATASDFVVYFFNLTIAIGTIVATVMIIVAGIDYVNSRGDPSKIEGAKKKIQDTLLGTVILLASFMILNTINPELAIIKIDDLSKEPKSSQTYETVKPTGVYLYKDDGDSLVLKSSKASLINEGFERKVKSIEFVNGENYGYGAVLFPEGDMEGNCSYLLSNSDNLGASNAGENNPPIGKDTLSSIIVFETADGSPAVKLYNNINCKKRSDEYGKQEEKTSVCTISSVSEFTNIKDSCKDFVGDVLSVEVNPGTAILFKDKDKNALGQCQFFTGSASNCINTIKYSYIYNASEKSPIKPFSYMTFSLYREE